MSEKVGKDIYMYSEGAAKKKAHQSRERAKSREKQQLKGMREKQGDPREKSQNVASVVWGGTKRGA